MGLYFNGQNMAIVKKNYFIKLLLNIEHFRISRFIHKCGKATRGGFHKL